MNIKNNKRKRQSMEKITKAFIDMLQTQELHKISVTDICMRAGLNRTTFYANYMDIYDLADKVLDSLRDEVEKLYSEEITQSFSIDGYEKILNHIYENQILYRSCFKLGMEELPILQYDINAAAGYFDNQYIRYHIEFFRGGFNRIVKLWLEDGCKESPLTISEIIHQEYKARI
ncbi:MAG: TetR/AcrR family transcriptional regulator C-terminal domain-containing protein [Lachnospiraceae bacterium]|nr:TetR/AcrR family transcriptional regulator C-terminal domain-containing protein [Lachnospiraceae bacterium]